MGKVRLRRSHFLAKIFGDGAQDVSFFPFRRRSLRFQIFPQALLNLLHSFVGGEVKHLGPRQLGQVHLTPFAAGLRPPSLGFSVGDFHPGRLGRAVARGNPGRLGFGG